MEEQKSRLVLICEDVHTLFYIWSNGVYPSRMVADLKNIPEFLGYLTKEDDLLIVLHGLTYFTMSEVYGLMQTINESKDKVKSVTLLSDIPLGIVPYVYYLYKGDLFCGSYSKVSPPKETRLGFPSKPIVEGEKESKMLDYVKYNNQKDLKEFRLNKPKSAQSAQKSTCVELTSIRILDMYGNKKAEKKEEESREKV